MIINTSITMSPYFIGENRKVQFYKDNDGKYWKRKFDIEKGLHGDWCELKAIATIGGDDY